MDSSLWWLVVLLSLFGASFVFYLILSTCMGSQLVQMFRGWVNKHYRSTKRAEWDSGGGGYRELSASSRSTRRAFLDGRGGNEGYEMATLGADERLLRRLAAIDSEAHRQLLSDFVDRAQTASTELKRKAEQAAPKM
ncbi:hypothetical protein JCM10296v2_001092 [Rhodotorula toruloides]